MQLDLMIRVAQRIEFGAAATVLSSLSEFTAFAQDRWVVNKKLTVDAGVRFDRDQLAGQNTISPRLSFLYLPLKSRDGHTRRSRPLL